MTAHTANEADALVLAQIAQRDVQALGTLYDRYGALLYRLALRITSDRNAAEEVVQLVFQGIWQSSTRLPHSGNVAHLLITRTRQCALVMTHRRHSTRDGAETVWEATDAARGEGNAAPAADERAVRTALQALPAHQREIIERAYYDGQTCAAIAAHKGRSLATVLADFRQGLLALHASLYANPTNID